MPRKKINSDSLTVALGVSVLQWGIDQGFGDSSVSELCAILKSGDASKKAKKAKTKKAKTKKAKTKKAKTQKTKTQKTKAKKSSRTKVAYDPQRVVSFITKHGQAKAADLQGLVPEDPNGRSAFMNEMIEQKLIRREGKARGTTYLPV